MIKNIWKSAFMISALAPTIAYAAMVTEPGRNGLPPTQVVPNTAHGGSPGSSMDAPGGVGPGFTNQKNIPPGIVAPGAIGRNGIEAPDGGGAR
ncbi:hypothetical protein [Methylocapsa sp. S129]|uniref:hypothetical protein n=1 Tax=Methylocapsa sp. S129 TaxID=1641869 RepID=UPI00131B3772|nr:hypothetical protein [Methylocapsa sp. S129]